MADVVPATARNLRRAAELLRAGQLVCFPTETVYGLGGDAGSSEAVKRIFAAKGRPAEHPLIVHLARLEQLPSWAIDVPESAFALGERFWPGPLTIVLKRGSGVPLEVTGGQETVAVRVPAHPVARRLLEEFGGAVAAPSANRFGRISPTLPEHAADELGDRVELVLDGGAAPVGVESTIVDLSGAFPRLLRPGAVSREQLAEVLGNIITATGAGEGPRVPGTLASHYAPTSPARLLSARQLDEEIAEALLGTEKGPGSTRGREQRDEAERPSRKRQNERAPERTSEAMARAVPSVLSRRPAPAAFSGHWLQLPEDPRGYAQRLYAALRELDSYGGAILIEEPPAGEAWEAVNDRLLRASASRGRQAADREKAQ